MNDIDSGVILKAQVRIMRLKSKMTWREVADVLAVRGGLDDLNVKYPYNFVAHDEVPGNRKIRCALGLPRVLPSERRPKKLRGLPVWGRAAGEIDIERRIK